MAERRRRDGVPIGGDRAHGRQQIHRLAAVIAIEQRGHRNQARAVGRGERAHLALDLFEQHDRLLRERLVVEEEALAARDAVHVRHHDRDVTERAEVGEAPLEHVVGRIEAGEEAAEPRRVARSLGARGAREERPALGAEHEERVVVTDATGEERIGLEDGERRGTERAEHACHVDRARELAREEDEPVMGAQMRREEPRHQRIVRDDGREEDRLHVRGERGRVVAVARQPIRALHRAGRDERASRARDPLAAARVVDEEVDLVTEPAQVTGERACSGARSHDADRAGRGVRRSFVGRAHGKQTSCPNAVTIAPRPSPRGEIPPVGRAR